jgi:hypothetical protein
MDPWNVIKMYVCMYSKTVEGIVDIHGKGNKYLAVVNVRKELSTACIEPTS